MIREIGIKNFVLIEELRLDFEQGLNVLTGETGAGKTIVLDALGLLLGDRFQSEQVRQGAEKSPRRRGVRCSPAPGVPGLVEGPWV